jgi:hypothetical protein
MHTLVNLLYTGPVMQQHLMLLEIPMTGERERKGEREKGRKGEREKGRKGEREKE